MEVTGVGTTMDTGTVTMIVTGMDIMTHTITIHMMVPMDIAPLLLPMEPPEQEVEPGVLL